MTTSKTTKSRNYRPRSVSVGEILDSVSGNVGNGSVKPKMSAAVAEREIPAAFTSVDNELHMLETEFEDLFRALEPVLTPDPGSLVAARTFDDDSDRAPMASRIGVIEVRLSRLRTQVLAARSRLAV